MQEAPDKVLVVGLGEVGKPLLNLLKGTYTAQGKDLEDVKIENPIDVMHICYPYESDDFVNTTTEYIHQYDPTLTIINSTVVPGTTRSIYDKTEAQIVYSPVRGKHVRMKEDLMKYTKFVSGFSKTAKSQAIEHFKKVGMSTAIMSSPETLEIAKLLETTYFGLLIAWAQEAKRFCKEVDADYYEVMKFTEEVDFFPPVIFEPGYIGGHCVIPNTYLLDEVRESDIVDSIRGSNSLKAEEWKQKGRSLDERLTPCQFKEDVK